MPGTTTPLKNEGNIPCKNATLRVALRYSCNTVFGKVGADLGNDKMLETAEKFGFNKEQFTPVRSNASVFSDNMNKSQTALVVDRSVQHRGHAAADGHGGLRGRQ